MAGVSSYVCVCLVPTSYRFPAGTEVILGNDLYIDEKTVCMVTRSQTKREKNSAERMLNVE